MAKKTIAKPSTVDDLIPPPYEWQSALCHPGKPYILQATDCHPSVQDRHIYADEAAARQHDYNSYSHMEYRGWCLGCDWTGPVRGQSEENLAVEDAHDHCFSGWRDLPIFEPPPAYPSEWDHKKRGEIIRMMRKTYPDGWYERGAPIRGWREDRISSRHVPGYSPSGGYNLGVVRDQPHHTLDETQTAAEPALQGSLF